MALFLAAIKRRQELMETSQEGRKVLAYYTVPLIDRYAEMAATGALLFYSLFVMSARPEMVFTIPFVLFGLFLIAPALTGITNGRINVFKYRIFQFLAADRQVNMGGKLTPGKPLSSLIFGGSFALGWSPCVGPILGVILTLAASSATVGQGAFLLLVFSLGLAVPFLLTALAIGWASKHFVKLGSYLNWVSIIGGIFLIVLGVFMATDRFLLWIGYVYESLQFLNYEEYLLDLL